MKHFILSIAILSFLAFTAMPLAHAATMSRPVPKFEDEIILHSDAPDATKKVHDAILVAATKYKWVVVSDNDSVLRLRLAVRRHTVEIDVRILGGAVNVGYVDSINMGYAENGVDAVGADHCNYVPGACGEKILGAVIHPNYGKWVRSLLVAARTAAN
ncbi:MAG: hypothetical protein LBL48_07735 [Azoarcus sp.]|jgi:hypothetical protein|nr:hypothetical protein [Azoarcus sp.]